jgi:ABC-2 type transport system ATP-binding protein
VIAEGTSSELKARVRGERLEVTVVCDGDLDAAARVLKPYAYDEGNVLVDAKGRHASVTVAGGARPLAAVVRDFDAAGVQLDDIGLRRPTLDDVFLALTGHAAQLTEDEGDAMSPDARREKEIA